MVNIGSVAGHQGYATEGCTPTCKAAVAHYTRCLAADMRASGVRVNCVSPGPTTTARFLATRQTNPDMVGESPSFERYGTPAEVADVVGFPGRPRVALRQRPDHSRGRRPQPCSRRDPMTRLNMALTAHGLPHVMGFLPTKAGESHPSPLSVEGLMDAAVESGLDAIEVGLPATEEFDPGPWREALRERGLRLVPDFGVLLEADTTRVRAFLTHAATLGATVVRVMLSTMLCGDRRTSRRLACVPWQRAARLNEVLPYAEEMGLCLAVENHQDATSDDLLRLAEMTGHSPAFGVTLDAGNPLAVGEDPVEFAARIAPLIRHVHLKDYTIHFAPEGYRLVRCAAGDGVVDFPAILASSAATATTCCPASRSPRRRPAPSPCWSRTGGRATRPATRRPAHPGPAAPVASRAVRWTSPIPAPGSAARTRRRSPPRSGTWCGAAWSISMRAK